MPMAVHGTACCFASLRIAVLLNRRTPSKSKQSDRNQASRKMKTPGSSPGVIEEAETGGSQLRLCQEQRVAVGSALFDSLLANIVASRGIEIPGRNGQTSQGLDLGLSESCFGRARRRGLVCQGGVRHRSKSEVCVAHA